MNNQNQNNNQQNNQNNSQNKIFTYLNPLPKNTETVLKKYKKVVVAEQNLGRCV